MLDAVFFLVILSLFFIVVLSVVVVSFVTLNVV
jgi:hypothetical protein